jgi:hypothetical protein
VLGANKRKASICIARGGPSEAFALNVARVFADAQEICDVRCQLLDGFVGSGKLKDTTIAECLRDNVATVGGHVPEEYDMFRGPSVRNQGDRFSPDRVFGASLDKDRGLIRRKGQELVDVPQDHVCGWVVVVDDRRLAGLAVGRAECEAPVGKSECSGSARHD